MAEKDETPSHRVFTYDDHAIERLRLRTSMTDGAFLTSYIYTNTERSADALPPLLCLPDELGRAKDHHQLALALCARAMRPKVVHTLSLRGRGSSDAKGVADTSILNDADDLISYCDARNLHHCDIVLNGRSIYTLLLALMKRPGLARRVVLNDAAPEYDAVAIARETTLNQRSKPPASWEEAVALMRDRKSEAFPAFSDEDWEHAVSVRWSDVDGRPGPTNDPKLVRFSNLIDYDAPQPRLWNEFKLLSAARVMLIRGENSALVTDEIIQRMKDTLPALTVETAHGQGHVPALHLGDLPETIAAFLAD